MRDHDDNEAITVVISAEIDIIVQDQPLLHPVKLIDDKVGVRLSMHVSHGQVAAGKTGTKSGEGFYKYTK